MKKIHRQGCSAAFYDNTEKRACRYDDSRTKAPAVGTAVDLRASGVEPESLDGTAGEAGLPASGAAAADGKETERLVRAVHRHRAFQTFQQLVWAGAGGRAAAHNRASAGAACEGERLYRRVFWRR